MQLIENHLYPTQDNDTVHITYIEGRKAYGYVIKSGDLIRYIHGKNVEKKALVWDVYTGHCTGGPNINPNYPIQKFGFANNVYFWNKFCGIPPKSEAQGYQYMRRAIKQLINNTEISGDVREGLRLLLEISKVVDSDDR